MSKTRTFTVSALTFALALGLWTLAAVEFDDASAAFEQGDVLQADELNALFDTIDANFAEAESRINANETAVGDLGATKADIAGETFTGRVGVEAEADGEGISSAATFYADNTASSGSAALFTSGNDDDRFGVVTAKQTGSAPVLTLKSQGGGPYVAGATNDALTFAVEEDGSVKLGDMGGSGTQEPSLHLDAAAGTITNDVGSGLPLAFGTVDVDGTRLAGSTNWSATYVESQARYFLDIDGHDCTPATCVTVVTPLSTQVVATTDFSSAFAVYLTDLDGARVQEAFAFVTFVFDDEQ